MEGGGEGHPVLQRRASPEQAISEDRALALRFCGQPRANSGSVSGTVGRRLYGVGSEFWARLSNPIRISDFGFRVLSFGLHAQSTRVLDGGLHARRARLDHRLS